MTVDHLSLLTELTRKWDADYNPQLHLLTRKFSSPGYHTTLKHVERVHPTREALVYALALLDTGLPEFEDRAKDVIAKVISLQDQDPSRHTFGIWSWFYEEPLEQMAPPDWNWADFCGKQLVLAVSRHKDRLGDELLERIRHATFCACDAIIKRNVGPGYTNIAIMGAFVTLIAGELYGHEPYMEYGLNRLRTFYEFTEKLGTFQEYNSPTYTIIAIRELSSIYTETRMEEAKRWTERLLHIAWRMTGEHFHRATMQWSGPHSRCYQTVMTDETLSFLEMATGGVVKRPEGRPLVYNFDLYKNEIHCPDDCLPLFAAAEERSINRIVAGGNTDSLNRATTHMNEAMTLGTFSKDVMWNQRRNMLAYMTNGDGFSYISLRLLHDGYDYSSAVFTSVQDEFDVLAGINFCTDGGDTHIGLDPIDGGIVAEDLRLRFEIGGLLGSISLPAEEELNAAAVGSPLCIGLGSRAASIQRLHFEFGEEEVVWETGESNGTVHLDAVLYAGERKRIDFTSMQRAALLFSFHLSDTAAHEVQTAAGLPQILADGKGSVISAAMTKETRRLEVSIPVQPATKAELLSANRSGIAVS